jgi:hypothetical protein
MPSSRWAFFICGAARLDTSGAGFDTPELAARSNALRHNPEHLHGAADSPSLGPLTSQRGIEKMARSMTALKSSAAQARQSRVRIPRANHFGRVMLDLG